MSSGRLGIVVVDVVVVVERSGTTVVDVVVVVVVVVVEEVEEDDEVVVDSVIGADGHDCVATVGTRRAGDADPALVVADCCNIDVVACSSMLVVEGVDVLVSGATVSNETSAKESAGATAGALLWVQVSN